MLKRRVISIDFDNEPEYTITPVEEVPVTNHVASTYSQAIEYDPNEFREYVPGTSYFTKSNLVFTAPPQDFSLRIGDSRKLVFTGRFYYLTRETLEYNNAFPNIFTAHKNVLKSSILVVGRSRGNTKIRQAIRYRIPIVSERTFMLFLRDSIRTTGMTGYSHIQNVYDDFGSALADKGMLNHYILPR